MSRCAWMTDVQVLSVISTAAWHKSALCHECCHWLLLVLVVWARSPLLFATTAELGVGQLKCCCQLLLDICFAYLCVAWVWLVFLRAQRSCCIGACLRSYLDMNLFTHAWTGWSSRCQGCDCLCGSWSWWKLNYCLVRLSFQWLVTNQQQRLELNACQVGPNRYHMSKSVVDNRFCMVNLHLCEGYFWNLTSSVSCCLWLPAAVEDLFEFEFMRNRVCVHQFIGQQLLLRSRALMCCWDCNLIVHIIQQLQWWQLMVLKMFGQCLSVDVHSVCVACDCCLQRWVPPLECLRQRLFNLNWNPCQECCSNYCSQVMVSN